MPDILYQGDEDFQTMLDELNCPKSLREIKALLNGSVAATEIVGPSLLIPAIFSDGEPEFDSTEQAYRFIGNLMGLWNTIADSIHDNMYFLDEVDYPRNVQGLIERLETGKSGILAFLQGLALGETKPNDLPEDGKEALGIVAESVSIFDEYLRLAEEDKPTQELIDSSFETLDKYEDVLYQNMEILIECIRALRIEILKNMRNAPVRNDKIGRNEPCPCGSGKKYKKCCLLKIN
jgi:uncharacterized protein